MSLLRLPLAILAAIAGQALLVATDADAQRRYDDRYDREYDRGYGNQDRGYDSRDRGYDNRSQRNVAGQFDYYALVLSWSPTHCATSNKPGDDMQCNRDDGRRYNFVLHGLWPQYDRGYPNDCPTRDRPFVPNNVIDKMLEIMPAKGLIIHEYRKHGTCSGLDPARYFDLARQLYNRIHIPERYLNPFDEQFVTPEELLREMTAANPELKPDMLAIACGGPGNRLKEIRICFTKDGQLRSCGHNENQRRMCSARQIYVPPVRSTWQDPRGGSTNNRRGQEKQLPQQKDFLPGPRI